MVCFICAADHPKYWAVPECNHRACSLCILRLRALYMTNQCPMCKTDSLRVLITGKQEGDFGLLFDASLPVDQQLGMWFESASIRTEILDILKLKCPADRCKAFFQSKTELKHHVSAVHSLVLCEICLLHKKVFAHEFKLFTRANLSKHQREGDGAGSKGHPHCGFCGAFFYSDDEFQEHCRDKHERCHICCRNRPGVPHYYRDYASLEGHFRQEHYLCPERLCLELKFIVFETELEYKAHFAEMHLSGKKLQRAQHRQLCQVDPSFVVGDGSRRRDNEGSPVRRPPGVPVPVVIPVNPTIATAIPVNPNFIFDESMRQLASNLQSLSLYEQRNDKVLSHLRDDFQLSDSQIDRFRSTCREFQAGRILAADLVARSNALFGYEGLKAVFPKLIELQLDSLKRGELANQFRLFVGRTESFPPLPPAPPPVAKAAQQPRVLTLRPSSSSKAHPAMADPTKNPARLLSRGPALTCGAAPPSAASTKKKKNATVPPSFNQVLQIGSAVSSSSSNRLDAASRSGNVFTESKDRTAPDSFVVGDEEKSSSDTATRGKKTRKKGQLVLKFG